MGEAVEKAQTSKKAQAAQTQNSDCRDIQDDVSSFQSNVTGIHREFLLPRY